MRLSSLQSSRDERRYTLSILRQSGIRDLEAVSAGVCGCVIAAACLAGLNEVWQREGRKAPKCWVQSRRVWLALGV